MSSDDLESDAEIEEDREAPGLLMMTTVNSGNRLPVPEELHESVFKELSGKPTTYWGYETSMNIALLCRTWRADPNTKRAGDKIYKLGDDGSIFIAKGIRENSDIDINGEIGEPIFFFSYGDMRDEGKAYLLSDLQAWKLLPEDALPDDGVERVVFREQPGFLSSIR